MIKNLCNWWVGVAESLQSVFLLAIRLYWGFGFMQAGWGKFMHWDKTVGFFTSLNIPMPEVNVAMAAGTELVGGTLLLLGLGSRIITIPIIFTMIVAYSTAHRVELLGILDDPKAFMSAPPFLFLYAAVIVLLFGAGKYSLDNLFCNKGKC